MTSKELIQELLQLTRYNIEVVRSNFLKLKESQLKWKKDNISWSIEEVFAHLNAYGSYYNPTFLARIENTKHTSPKEIFVSSPLGKSAWKSMKLGNLKNVKRKMKSPKTYNPIFNEELITGNEVEKFNEQQQLFIEILSKADNVNLRRVKIPISISKIIRLRLGDALLFVAYHNERHLQQATNILNHPKFPNDF
jgi:hypothetical protein